MQIIKKVLANDINILIIELDHNKKFFYSHFYTSQITGYNF